MIWNPPHDIWHSRCLTTSICRAICSDTLPQSVHGDHPRPAGAVPNNLGRHLPWKTTPQRLDENVDALDVELTEEETGVFDALASQVAGDRYPDMTATANSRETR